MKKDIHPDYVECNVICSCGNTFKTKATKSELKIDICNVCHPFYTGTQKLIDTGGRVQRFSDRFGVATEIVKQREEERKAKRAAEVAAADEKKSADRAQKAKAKEERAAKYAQEAAKAAEQAPKEEKAEEAPAEQEVASEEAVSTEEQTSEATETAEAPAEETAESQEAAAE